MGNRQTLVLPRTQEVSEPGVLRTRVLRARTGQELMATEHQQAEALQTLHQACLREMLAVHILLRISTGSEGTYPVTCTYTF